MTGSNWAQRLALAVADMISVLLAYREDAENWELTTIEPCLGALLGT